MTGLGNDVTLAFRMLLRQPGFTAIALLTLALEHRRHHRDLQRRQRRRAAAAAIRRERTADRAVREERAAGLDDVLGRAGELRRLGAQARARSNRWSRCRRDPRRSPRTRAPNRCRPRIATAELFQVFRAHAGNRPHVRRRRRHAWAPRRSRSSATASGSGASARIRQRWDGSSPSTIDRRPIVGVMNPGFGEGRPDTDLWLPLTIDGARAARGGRTLRVVGRLAGGATLEQARAELDTIASALERQYPDENGGWGDDAGAARAGRGRLRRQERAVPPARRGRLGAADRLRQRRQPALGTRHRAPARVRGPRGARRRALPPGASAADRERGAGRNRRRCSGLFARGLGNELLLALAPAGLPRAARGAARRPRARPSAC